MDRPELVHIDKPLFWTIRIHDSAGQPVAPASIEVAARVDNGLSSSAGITVVEASTGVFDVSLTGQWSEGQILSITETVVRNSKTFINGWQATVIARERGSNEAAAAAVSGSMAAAAAMPVSVSADGTSVSMPSVMDRIEADAYDKANAAVKKPRRGLMFSRLIPGSAVGPRD